MSQCQVMPTPIVDVKAFCLKIETSIQATYQPTLAYFDFMLVWQRAREYTTLSQDLDLFLEKVAYDMDCMMLEFDYLETIRYQRNGFKVVEKRLKDINKAKEARAKAKATPKPKAKTTPKVTPKPKLETIPENKPVVVAPVVVAPKPR